MDKTILLAHGSGGKLSHELIRSLIAPGIANDLLNRMDDSAILDISGRIAFTTDSFVVNPLFFPGGDIGKLAVCGTINDLSVMGASPLYLSLSLIIEEGLPTADLEKIMHSISAMTAATGVRVVTGDTKVVNRGSADKLFINTAGIGSVPDGLNISGANAQPGDQIILSGTIGDHGVAVMAGREKLRFKIPVESDCAPLNSLTADIISFGQAIHSMRDPTRVGLATTLNEIASQSQVDVVINETSIPVKEAVNSACELLGLDPLYVANEGKLIVFAAADQAQAILNKMQQNPLGRDSAIIGEVRAKHSGHVVLKTAVGASRIIDMLSGELLPRIC